MECHFFLQAIFLTQGSNLGLPHHSQILYRLSHREAIISPMKVKTSMVSSHLLYQHPRGWCLGLRRSPDDSNMQPGLRRVVRNL